MVLTAICQDAKTIGISGHNRPDGDCVGATTALYMYLKKVAKEAAIVLALEQPSDSLQVIPGVEYIDDNFAEREPFDVFFAVDCNEERLGDALPYYRQAKVKVNIDHHISNQGGYADYEYIVPDASSASELIYDLILADRNGLSEEEKIDKDIALSIYMGIIHDTGVFQYSNTSPKTLEIAAKLITYGFDFPKLIEESFYRKSYAQNKLMAKTILGSELYLNGRCIVGVVTKADMDEFEVRRKELEGIVNQLRNTKGVDCAVFLSETEEGEYKASLRCNEKLDVSKIAQVFGGGGHVRASGCTLKGNLDQIKEKIVAQIKGQLEDEK